MTYARLRQRLAICVVVAATALAGIHTGNPVVSAQSTASAKLDPALTARLATVTPATPLDVVVVFADVGAASSVQALAARFHRMKVLPMAGAILTPDQIRTIADWPDILSITLNTPLKYFVHESVELVGADDVWTMYGQTGGNVTVAVIDSGVDATHPDLTLGSKVIQNVKVTPYGESLENMALTDTSSGHGTHVAGTIGGNGVSSGGYYRGIAPDVKLVGLGAGEGINILTAVQAYDWVLEHHEQYNIRVVSNSWGQTGGDIILKNPIVMATLEGYRRGILSVFAAGNDGGYNVINPYSQAPWVLSVAAGKKDRSLADFSSRGLDGDYFKHPDITAPGVDIYATRLTTPGASSTDPFLNPVNPLWTPRYVAMSGTSMATPQVSGAAALLFSSNPQLSPDQVMTLLTSTATPMPGYALHEAGYGYLNVRAAYEASRTLTGNMPAFLAGQQQHSEHEVLGFDLNQTVPFEEFVFSGLTPVGAGGAPGPIDHTFEVPPGTLYVDVSMTWTPQDEDAYDIEILDPRGVVKASSGNGLNSPEAALFVPDLYGTYTLRIHPFAAVASQYEARVKVAYGTPPDWPPTTAATHDVYLGITGIYKLYVAAGLPTYDYRTGDRVWVNFTMSTPDGQPIDDAAREDPANAMEPPAKVQIVYRDRHGRILNAPATTAIFNDGAGEYSTYVTLNSVQWAPGPIGVSFLWLGDGRMRAAPAEFRFNMLDVTVSAAGSGHPGGTVAFSGTVTQTNPVASGTVETAMIGGARVTMKLVSGTGATLATTQVQTDAEGRYSGSIVAPSSARGQARLVAEAGYTDATIATGQPEWWGSAAHAIRFPGNLPPTATVGYVRESGGNKNHFYVTVNASVSDADGRGDVTGISLVLADARGRTIGRWSGADFTAANETSWSLSRTFRISGSAPWTLTLTAGDSVGQTVTRSVTIN